MLNRSLFLIILFNKFFDLTSWASNLCKSLRSDSYQKVWFFKTLPLSLLQADYESINEKIKLDRHAMKIGEFDKFWAEYFNRRFLEKCIPL